MHGVILQTVLALLLASPALAGWTPAVRISEQATSYGPRMAANGDTLHVVYWTNLVGTNQVYYLSSHDGGGAWNTPFLLPDSTQMFACVSPIIRISGNNVVAIWKGNIRGGGTDKNFGFRLSTNFGIGWNDANYVLDGHRYGLQKLTFTISETNILLFYSRTDQEEIVIEFTKSTNWGQSWTTPTEVFRTIQTGLFDMVARGDTIHVAWPGKFTWEYPVWEIYYIKSDDGGQTWTENTSLGSIDEWGSMYPSIAINERGDLAVCWVDFKYSPYWWTGDLFVRYSYDSGESWIDEEQIIFTHSAESPRILWQGDSLHIAWQDSRYGGPDPFYKASYDNGLTWEAEQRIDNDQMESFSPDLAVVGDNIHVIWDENRQYDQGRGIYYSCWDEEVGIEEKYEILPTILTLTAYPNPFNGATTITYNLSEGGEIEIYNIRGQLIRRINTTAREGKIMWDARDALGNKVSSGIYFARAKGADYDTAIKLLYLK